jgi:hypothetical protein
MLQPPVERVMSSNIAYECFLGEMREPLVLIFLACLPEAPTEALRGFSRSLRGSLLHLAMPTMHHRSNPRLTVVLPTVVFERIAHLSNQQGRSMSSLVAHLLENALQRHKPDSE